MIDTADLYEILDVPRNADAKTLSKSSRSKIFSLHPDRGGSPDDFFKVQGAFDTLSDPVKRAYYDACGLVDANDAKIAEDAEKTLADITVSIFHNMVRLDFDLFDGIRHGIQNSIASAEIVRVRSEEISQKFFLAASRIQRFGEGKNVIALRLIEKATEYRQQAQRAAMTIAVNRKAMEIIGCYSYEADVALPAPTGWTITMSTFS